MARRGRSGPAVSLFAFQDIITCVSGIIIVMVLILALELIERPQLASGATSEDQRIHEAIASAEERLRELTAGSQESDELIRDLTSASPVQLHQDIALAQATLAALRRELDEQAAKSGKLATASVGLAAERQEREKESDALDRAARINRELERQLQRESRQNRPVYALPRGTTKSGWLVVLESRQVTVAPLGQSARPMHFARKPGSLFGGSAARQFLGWLRQQPSANSYFLVLIRPNAVAEFDEIETALTAGGYSFGFDVVGQDQLLIDPDRGAGE